MEWFNDDDHYQRRSEGNQHHVPTDQLAMESLLSQCYFCLVSSSKMHTYKELEGIDSGSKRPTKETPFQMLKREFKHWNLSFRRLLTRQKEH